MRVRQSHSEFFTQVKPTHFRVFCQVSWLAGSKNSTLSHDIGPISHAESFSNVVIGDENTNTTTTQIKYYILYVVDRLGIDAGERFIKEYVLRFSCQ